MTKLLVVITSIFILCGYSIKNNNDIGITSNIHVQKNVSQYNKNLMSVKEFVKGNDVFVECVISDFTFSKRDGTKKNKQGYGFLQLYLNGKKIDNIYTAAFIIKGLPIGKHQIKLELVNNDGTPYGIEHNFEVEIS
ncbi:hypothetical protein [Calidifontibacillus oryziterrae]|uniref:hypothetical protein n=1 Tax=Calidifontibacillus oryziterrae TaxID=1191699 RepID=UPI00031D526E|nr:hypothetical protein [Calidifontibacillus oryziterrae]